MIYLNLKVKLPKILRNIHLNKKSSKIIFFIILLLFTFSLLYNILKKFLFYYKEILYEKNLYSTNYIKKNKELFFLRKKLTSANDTYKYIKPFYVNFDKEILVAITLDSKNYVTSISIISIGTINSLHTTPSEVFKTTIITNSTSIILVHNHPSGDPTPSKHDIEETLRFVKCSNLLGIKFLDHIIIGDDNFFSFKKHNII